MEENIRLMVNTEQSPVKIFNKKILKSDHLVGKLYQQTRPAILFVRKGKATINIQINTIEVYENSVLLSDQDSIFQFQKISADFDFQVVLYTNSFIEKLGLKLNKLKVFKHFKTHINKIAHLPSEELQLLWTQSEVLEAVINNPADHNYSQDITEHLFSAFVYSVSGSLLKQQELSKDRMSRQEDIAFEFVKNVFENFKQERALQFYAQQQNLTIRHLSAVVKSVTQKTANQIISEFVLNEAKILLNAKKISIGQIAEYLKFSDPYSFSHFFKKHEGVSPSQYRAQVRN